MKNKKSLIVLLIVLILVAGVAFAAFSDTLSISGTANAKGSFDVEFTAASLNTELSTGIDVDHSTASVSLDRNTVTIDAKDLVDTNSRAVFNVTVHNNSTTQATLNGINVTYNNNENELFEVTSTLQSGTTLDVNDSQTYQVTVKLTENPIDTTNAQATFNISLTYGQQS